jgi:two-component system CheB/CheR fusion protein
MPDPTQDWITHWLAHDTDHAVFLLSTEGRVTAWHGAAARLFGHTRAQAIGLPFSAFFTPDDAALGLDRQELVLAREGGRSEDDRWHVRRDGSVFWASGVLTALRDAAGQPGGYCKVVRDRTDVRTQVAALENQLHARSESLDALHRVTAEVGHELRSPLMPMSSAIALLQRTDDAALRQRACEILERQLGHLKRLIDDLNERSTTTASRVQVQPQRVDAGSAVAEVAESYRERCGAREQRLTVVLPSAPIWIAADPVRLRQMVGNLVDNAVKYTPVRGRVRVSLGAEGGMAVVRVEDDGRGIDPAVLPRIFELFTREDRPADAPGLGIGLAVVHDLAARHGGSVEARSPGHGLGSVFALRLPLWLDGPRDEPPAAEPAAGASR